MVDSRRNSEGRDLSLQEVKGMSIVELLSELAEELNTELPVDLDVTSFKDCFTWILEAKSFGATELAGKMHDIGGYARPQTFENLRIFIAKIKSTGKIPAQKAVASPLHNDRRYKAMAKALAVNPRVFVELLIKFRKYQSESRKRLKPAKVSIFDKFIILARIRYASIIRTLITNEDALVSIELKIHDDLEAIPITHEANIRELFLTFSIGLRKCIAEIYGKELPLTFEVALETVTVHTYNTIGDLLEVSREI